MQLKIQTQKPLKRKSNKIQKAAPKLKETEREHN